MFRKSFAVLSLSCLTAVSFASIKTTLVGCHGTGKDSKNHTCIYVAKDSSTKQQTYLYAQTNMPYALCSKSLCQKMPNDPKHVSCACDVYGQGWQALSVGPKSFKESQPTYAANKELTTVTSNFSMANLKSMKTKPVTCKSKTAQPWANCFGVRCQVTYVKGHPTAQCTCPVATSKVFISVGPKTQKECFNKKSDGMIWSAALETQGQSNGVIMPAMYQQFFKNQKSKK